MSISKKRIIVWLFAILIGIVLVKYSNYVENKPEPVEKQNITVCAPADMEKAFEKALYFSNLKDTHQIVMTEDHNADLCVDYGKQNDDEYKRFAFSPFIVAYDDDSEYFDELIEANVCVKSIYDKNDYEIDFSKVINEVIGQGEWTNLGIKDQGKIIIFYPDETSEYWNDFHDFLLVNANNGEYPENEQDMENAEAIVKQFVESKYTQGINDFSEQAIRTGGFPSTVFYVLPEQKAAQICSDQSVDSRFLYPKNTVYMNYYVKGNDLGQQLISVFEKKNLWNSSFYYYLHCEYYRTINNSAIDSFSGYVYDGRDEFNVVKIPSKNN